MGKLRNMRIARIGNRSEAAGAPHLSDEELGQLTDFLSDVANAVERLPDERKAAFEEAQASVGQAQRYAAMKAPFLGAG